MTHTSSRVPGLRRMAFFEELIVTLLLSMGYGGSREEAAGDPAARELRGMAQR
jgi:hypothetical protein